MSHEHPALQQAHSHRRLLVFCTIGCALLVSLLWSSVMAAPPSQNAPTPLTNITRLNALAPLTDITRALDFSAKGGHWTAANRQHQELAKRWAAVRPAIVTGNRETAQAQSIDASMKWLQSAIDQRDAGNVHRAALTITKAIHEIQEMPAAHR
jgi:hypothetical protein